MDEKEFRRLLKKEEDMREKGTAAAPLQRGDVIQLNLTMDEFMKRFEQLLDELDKALDDETVEFYFEPSQKRTSGRDEKHPKKKRTLWRVFDQNDRNE